MTRNVFTLFPPLDLTLAAAPGASALHMGGPGAHVALRSTGCTLRLTGGGEDEAVSVSRSTSKEALDQLSRSTYKPDDLKEARRSRLAGGTAAGEDGGDIDLKAAARRRAEQARNAGSHPRDSVMKTVYRVFFSATNKLGLTVCAQLRQSSPHIMILARHLLPATLSDTNAACRRALTRVRRARRLESSTDKLLCGVIWCRSYST